MKTRILTLLLCLSAVICTNAQTPAFPGAEGFGRYVTGGRGGKVIHVKNLNDKGTGSFRAACETSGTRTIVFDVAGTIYLQSELQLKNGNVTIAGQTSPGGICVGGFPFTIKADNVIIRYMSFRPGSDNVAKHEGDGLGAMDRKNIIVDHCSVSWSVDECLSVYGSTNLTVQWCTSTHSMVFSGHEKGNHGYGGNWGGSGASYHHNLISHHTSRCPRLGPRPGTQTDERMDLRNCVMYNYGSLGCYGGEGMKVNIVNNYYKPGTVSNSNPGRIAGIGIRTTSYTGHGTSPNNWDIMWHVWGKFFVDGNVNPQNASVTKDNWTYGIYNQISNSSVDNTFTKETKDTMRLNSPLPFVHVTTHTAEKAYEKVLAYAGNSLYRDKYDQLVIADVKNGTAVSAKANLPAYDKSTLKPNGKYLDRGYINSQYDINYASAADHDEHFYPILPLDESRDITDSDNDGMPDSYEDANGLNKNSATDGTTKNAEGYTNLEVYLNSLVAHITEAQNAEGEVLGYETAAEAKEAALSVWTPIMGIPQKAQNATYNLSGQKVGNAYRGIVIKNGKKVLLP